MEGAAMTAPAYGDGTPASPRITIQEGVAPDRRRNVELAVDTLVKRAGDASARAQDAATGRSKRSTALNRPLLELLRSDAEAAKALDGEPVRPEPLGDLERLRARSARAGAGRHAVILELGETPEVFGLPFHFSWTWHVHGGGGPFTEIAEEWSGNLGLDARAAPPPDGIDVPFINAHAGVGISLSSDREVHATARALRRVGYAYSVAAGFEGDATVEGGEELTVIEQGRLLDSDQYTAFRKRVSGTVGSWEESATFDTGGWGTGDPLEVSWTMLPGHHYEFNVGEWVVCERNPGLGGAGALAQISGKVVLMTLFR
jgi:hypothetical protein